ncbi:hypothetical protein ACFQ3N_07570 [Virgibacillus byunsanensis]|uniref:Transposase n=1 Tax=Virgibacillus byunsanensis TaxID=570945 RepID=A0ABW3LJH9_9BACI
MGYDPGVSFHAAVYSSKGVKLAIPSNKGEGAYNVMQAVEGILL